MQLFAELVLTFTLYSFLGWVCESIYCSIPEKRWINRGFLNGPFCPIYGFGAFLILVALTPIEQLTPLPLQIPLVFVAAVFLTTTLEYWTSVLLEKLFHTSWWDYSHHKYQLHGRICLTNSLLFGLMSVVVLKGVHPLMEALIDRIPEAASFAFAGGLVVYFALDGTVTVLGILRLNGKLAQLQFVLDEIRERTALLAENSRTDVQHSLEELRERTRLLKPDSMSALRRSLEELRLKTDTMKAEGLEHLRESIQARLHDELSFRLRFLQDKQEYLESDSHPMYRRLMDAFPHMRSIQTPESFQRLKEAAKMARDIAQERTKKNDTKEEQKDNEND